MEVTTYHNQTKVAHSKLFSRIAGAWPGCRGHLQTPSASFRRPRRVPVRPHSDEPRARRDRLAHRRQGRGQSVPATTRADPSGAARLGRDRLPFLLCCNDAIGKHRSTRVCRQAATGLSKARGQARMPVATYRPECLPYLLKRKKGSLVWMRLPCSCLSCRSGGLIASYP